MLTSEPVIRLACFAAVFSVVALAERLWPRRPGAMHRRRRWPGNLGIVVLNTMVARVVLPVSAVGFAQIVAEHHVGLLPATAIPAWAAIPLSLVALDLAIYVQHVVFHAVPVLWRLHRMHHADTEFDVSTAARFHTLEILLSFIWKFAVIAALGALPVAVLAFEVILSSVAMFNHANLRLPPRLDALLRLVLVTPDMHRVHHSTLRAGQNSNFGFNLPLWDRLFGTYRPAPPADHAIMTIGTEQYRDESEARLDRMLTQPFR